MKAKKLFLLLILGFSLGLGVSPGSLYASETLGVGDADLNAPKLTDIGLEKRYGDWLFNGSFKHQAFAAVNPNYRISQGDTLSLQIWGAINYQEQVVVDAQGNIFIPRVGPVNVLGVANSALNNVMLKHIKRVYKDNVEVYVSLMSSQKVKVFLAGMVSMPGMYEGQSADTILRFIDQAGGIRHDLGGYRSIQVKRDNTVLKTVDLYQFLHTGELPHIQLQDGDVILVNTRQGEIAVQGDVGFNGLYELKGQESLEQILKKLVVSTKATHATLITSKKTSQYNDVFAESYQLSALADVQPTSGDIVKVSEQNQVKSISVSVKGEHLSAQEIVLPWGASLASLLEQVDYSTLSNKDAIQLYRPSVAARQFSMLQASLNALEQNVLTTRSQSTEAAKLREAEAGIILKWIEKARQVEPKGQVLLSRNSKLGDIILQQGDEIVVPAKRNLILVHGEVLFPTAIAYEDTLSIEDFIAQAGGVSNGDLDKMNVLLMKPNGRFIHANKLLSKAGHVGPGDEIFVLAKPDEKTFQFAKDLTQVIYQVALSAAVVLAL